VKIVRRDIRGDLRKGNQDEGQQQQKKPLIFGFLLERSNESGESLETAVCEEVGHVLRMTRDLQFLMNSVRPPQSWECIFS
jgi:hypothetical protein